MLCQIFFLFIYELWILKRMVNPHQTCGSTWHFACLKGALPYMCLRSPDHNIIVFQKISLMIISKALKIIILHSFTWWRIRWKSLLLWRPLYLESWFSIALTLEKMLHVFLDFFWSPSSCLPSEIAFAEDTLGDLRCDYLSALDLVSLNM